MRCLCVTVAVRRWGESLGLKYEGENGPCPDCGGATETDELGIIHHFHNAECRIASRLEALTDEEHTIQ